MKTAHQLLIKLEDKRGAVIIVVAVAVAFFLIGFAALAIDVGYFMVVKNELQNIADGAALGATAELGEQYVKKETINDTDIKNVAVDIGNKNRAGDLGSLSIDLSDIEIGTWDQDADPKFDPGATPPNAVKVTARRDGSKNSNSVRTFFGGVLGVDSVGVNADATAALLAPIKVFSPIPVGISKYWFNKSHWPETPEDNFCNQDIKFHPTGDLEGCAGWHNYYDPDNPEKSNANASKLKTILEGLKTGDFIIPETIVGETKYAFIGGTVASAFDEMVALFNKKGRNCGDNTDNWCADVVVYDRDDCSNPNKSITIVGFAPVVITGILGPPQKTIEGRVLCDKVVWAEGGGGEYYGELGSIPKLVE